MSLASTGSTVINWFEDLIETHEIDPPVAEKMRQKRLTTPHRLMVLNQKTTAEIVEFLGVDLDDTQAMLLKFALNSVTDQLNLANANYTENSTSSGSMQNSASSNQYCIADPPVENQPPDPDPVPVEEERDSDALVEMLKIKHFKNTFDPEAILASLVIDNVVEKSHKDRIQGGRDYIQNQAELLEIIKRTPSLTRKLADVCISTKIYPDHGKFMKQFLDNRQNRRTEVIETYTRIQNEIVVSQSVPSSQGANNIPDLVVPRNEIHFVRRIGAGFFCQVHEVQVRGRTMAAKIPTITQTAQELPNGGPDPETNYRLFVQEILHFQLGRFNHRNIVQMLGSCTDVTPYIMLLEYMPEGALTSYLLRNRQMLSPATLVSFCLQTAEAIKFLHGKGYIHCDVSGRNVLVASERIVKLADFGLAKGGII